MSFELCRNLGFDSYISPALKEQHSKFANQCTGRQRIEATWPKWKGHLRVNICSTLAKSGDPWWSSSFNTHGTLESFENVESLHQGRWEEHVVSCSSCMKISTLLTAGSCTVKPCDRNLQSANDHRFVWRSFSNFRKKHMNFANFIEPGISYTVGFIFEEWISSAHFNAREFRQKMRWAMGRNCPARRLMWDWQRMGRNMSKSYLIWTITLVTHRYRKSIAWCKLILWYMFIVLIFFPNSKPLLWGL